jgi:hypothetical protein
MLHTKFRFIWSSDFWGEDFFKSTIQKEELPVVAMFVNGSGQNVPSFSSFGWVILEEKIKMWKANGRQTPSDGKSSRYLWQGELKIFWTSMITMVPMVIIDVQKIFS